MQALRCAAPPKAPSGRELSPKVTEGDCGQCHPQIRTKIRPPPDCPATLSHAAHCIFALWLVQQSPSVTATPCHRSTVQHGRLASSHRAVFGGPLFRPCGLRFAPCPRGSSRFAASDARKLACGTPCFIGLTSACFAHCARPSCASSIQHGRPASSHRPALTLARCSVAAHCASLRVLATSALRASAFGSGCGCMKDTSPPSLA